MDDRQAALHTYLNDHDAGAEAALRLMQHLGEAHEGTSASTFLARLHDEVAQDRAVLQDIMRALGIEEQRTKRLVADLAEKLVRAQLTAHTKVEELGLLMGLETLTSGVSGKLALWQALDVVASSEPRLAEVDFADLRARARDQLDGLERERLVAAALI